MKYNPGNLQLEKVNWEQVKEIFTPEKEDFLTRVEKAWEKYPAAGEALTILAGFGVISLAILMPGLGKTIAGEMRNSRRTRYRTMWRRFEKQKLVMISEDKDGNTTVEITQDGIKRALKYKLESMKIKKPRRWDQKWRLVIFDVKEERRGSRDRFRENLRRLGFRMINESVFIHPYPCYSEIEFLRQISGIGTEVTYIEADKIETSADLKRYFQLE